MIKFAASLLALVLCLSTPAARAVTELQLWHAMEGPAAEAVQRLADRFNASQQAYHLVPSQHGSDEDTLKAGLAAAAAGKGPHLLQVSEASASDMLADMRAIKPLHQLAAETRVPLDRTGISPGMGALYSDASGKLVALPFNASTPLLLFNREAFIKAGLDPDKPPVSWYQLQPMLIKLQEAGEECPYTTSWQSWIHLVNVSAHHNNPFASANNGYGSSRPELLVNGHLMIRHISLLSAWLKSDLFSYSGRGNAGDLRFAKGECAIITTSSEAWPEIRRTAQFTVVAAPLPHYDDFNGAPYNTLMGGGALWTMSGKTTAEYAGVAQFLQFLSSPAAVEDWHQNTGFLPVTRTAENALRKIGYYAMRPFAEIASRQLHGGSGGAFSRGVRLRHFTQIRSILDEELEAVWNNIKPPKLALDDAVMRGNALLKPLAGAIPAASSRPAPTAHKPVARPQPKPAAQPNCQGCR